MFLQKIWKGILAKCGIYFYLEVITWLSLTADIKILADFKTCFHTIFSLSFTPSKKGKNQHQQLTFHSWEHWRLTASNIAG